jgi:hypothetical protein
MYNYETEKQKLFTDEGQRMVLAIRDHVRDCLELAGAVSMGAAINVPGVCGESWMMMACVDRLVELDYLREIPQREVAGQYRIFVQG